MAANRVLERLESMTDAELLAKLDAYAGGEIAYAFSGDARTNILLNLTSLSKVYSFNLGRPWESVIFEAHKNLMTTPSQLIQAMNDEYYALAA